jgi:hypothetical protein
LNKLLIARFGALASGAAFDEKVPNLGNLLGRKAVMRRPDWGDPEYFRQVQNRVARNRECESRLPLGCAFAVSDQKSAYIEHGGKCGEPGLIVVLGAKIAEHRIRQVALHQLRGPNFPVTQIRSQDFVVRELRVSA